MEIANPNGSFQEGDAGRFIGRVWLSPGVSAPDGTGSMVVHFSAAARTHWHAHPGGQVLHCVSGRGRVRSRGERGHVLRPGDIVYIPPGEVHYHGGGPDSPMAHLSVSIGAAEWSDPVSDEEYDEGF